MHNCKRTIHSIHFIPLTHIACIHWLQPIIGTYEKLPKIHSSPEPAWRWMKILPSWVATCCASTLRVLNSLRCYVLPTNTKHTTRARDSRTVGIQHKEVIRRQRERVAPNEQQPQMLALTLSYTLDGSRLKDVEKCRALGISFAESKQTNGSTEGAFERLNSD